MICVTIAQEDRNLLLADMLNAAAMGADMVEVRLDTLDKAPKFSDMLEAKRLPILFSCRRPQDGGNWQGTEDERLMILRQAIMSKADYVEMEYDVAEDIRPFPGCKRVVSYTNKEKMPSAISDIYDDMLNLAPDVIKLTVRARTPEEAWPLVQILGKPKVPTVVVGLGRTGAMLAILGKKIGCPWTAAALEKGMEAFPGQPTIQELVDVYRYRDIGKPTRLVGVTGLGEREFLTTGLMNAAFAHLGLPHRVLPLQVGNLKLFRKVIDIVKMQGVTMDDAHYELLHEAATLDETAKVPVQAGDLLMPAGEQGWTASNAVGRWAVAALEETLRKREPDKENALQGRICMFAGCGPLARMIAGALKAKGALVVFASRDRTEAQRLSQAFGGRQIGWDGIYATIHDVLILCRDKDEDEADEDRLPLHPGYLKSTITVMDLTNIPNRSRFLDEAKLRSCGIVPPASLLLEQVREHVHRIGGKEIEREVLRKQLRSWFDDGTSGEG